MAQAVMTVDVGKDETTAQLLERMNRVPPRSHVQLRLPNDARALRELDDFNDLRRFARSRDLQFIIASPEKTVRGLAGILGFEIEGKTGGGAMAAAPPLAYTPPTQHTPPARPAQMAAPPALSPVPVVPFTDNDWLLTGDAGDDPLVEARGGATPAAPSGPSLPTPRIMGSAPARPAGPPAAPLMTPTAPAASSDDDDLDSMNFDADELDRASHSDLQVIAQNAVRPDARPLDEVPVPAPARSTNGGGMFGGRGRNRTEQGRGNHNTTVAAAAGAAGAAALAADAPIYDMGGQAEAEADMVAASAAPLEGTVTRGEVLRMGGDRVTIAPRPNTRTARQPQAQAQGRRGSLVGPLLALLILLGLGVAAWLIVPPMFTQATVLVLPGSEQISREVVVPVSLDNLAQGGSTITGTGMVPVTGTLTTPPAPADPSAPMPPGPIAAAAITAQTFSATISDEGTTTTTGVREQAAGKDRLALALTNPLRAAVTLGAGTEVYDDNGVRFALVRAVTVPAAVDTGTSLVYGQASVEAEALAVGPHNVGVRAIGGTFASGIRFYNTIAASGGYMEKIATVAQADVDRLRADVFGRLQPRVNPEILKQVPADMVALPATLDVPQGNWRDELDKAVGQDATEIRLKISTIGSIKAYRPDDISKAVQAAVQGSVQSGAPGAPQLGGPIEQGPIVAGALVGGNPTYRTTITATIQYAITPEMRDHITSLVQGQPVAQAADMVRASYDARLRDVRVDANFLGFHQDKVPTDPARITVRQDDGSGN